MANVLLTEAVRLTEMGFAVFPCVPGQKRPLCEHGLHDATTDPDRIKSWWREHPNANIGLRCDKLLVVDVDPQGKSWPGEARARGIKSLRPPVQRTPRQGWHIAFRLPLGVAWKSSVGRLAHGVDTRVGGGAYIVAAPSCVNGKSYVWLRPLKRIEQLPEPPMWLCEALDEISRPAPARPVDPCDAVGLLTEGCRNDSLFRLGCRLRRLGASVAEIESTLLVFNASRCCPPLDETEVSKIATSIGRYPADAGDSWLRAAWNYHLFRRRTAHGR